MNAQEWTKRVESTKKWKEEEKKKTEFLKKQREEVEEFLESGKTTWERSSELSDIILEELKERGFMVLYYSYLYCEGKQTFRQHCYNFSVKE